MTTRTTSAAVAALLIATLMPALAAGEHLDACERHTTPAFEVNGVYMVGTAYTFWQETNGIPGLQQRSTACEGHPNAPADRCVLSTTGDIEPDLYCTTGYVAQL